MGEGRDGRPSCGDTNAVEVGIQLYSDASAAQGITKRKGIGKVKANAMVTNPEYPPSHIDAFINLFKYAQQFYGQKMKSEFSFSMFYSEPPFADLIFQDAAQKIIVLPEGELNMIMITL